MSTRSLVIIKDGKKRIDLYHHWDGYIEGVGFDLLERFWVRNGELCEKLKSSIEAVANKLVKDTETNYEITFGSHIDIEYLYIIDIKEGTLYCHEVFYEYNESSDDYDLHTTKVWTLREIYTKYLEFIAEQKTK